MVRPMTFTCCPSRRTGALRIAPVLLFCAVFASGCRRDALPHRLPDVVLVTLDTTRADRLGPYGYKRPTTPALDRLAADANIYTMARSTSSWTLPAHASLFTGRLPASHGASYDPDGPLVLTTVVGAEPGADTARANGLAPGIPTLAELLGAAGYATAGVVAGPWMASVFGLARGFAHWGDDQIDSVAGARAPIVTEQALRQLDAADHRPLFLFLNYFDPHAPYDPPQQALDEVVPGFVMPQKRSLPVARDALYDGEIRAMDDELGRVLERLRELGRYDDALIVVTADHGEQLGDHGLIGHGYSLFEEEIRVPLIVKLPTGAAGAGSRRIDAPVSLTDVFALILAQVGLPLPDDIQGEVPPAHHPIVAETRAAPRGPLHVGWRAIVDGRFKLLTSSDGERHLFDLEADPHERHDLAALEAERVHALHTLLDTYVAGLPRPSGRAAARVVDEQTRRALEGLGYLESGEHEP
jgi:arylsulfatase A-like enzyme